MRQDELKISGHSIEARIYAEDPLRNFLPDSGKIQTLQYPREDRHFRLESGAREGDTISPFYDPMIAKVVVHDTDRDKTICRLQEILSNTRVVGLATNINFVQTLLRHGRFIAGTIDSNFIDKNLQDFIKVPSSEHVAYLVCAFIMCSDQKSAWSSIAGQFCSFLSISINSTAIWTFEVQRESQLLKIKKGEKEEILKSIKRSGPDVSLQVDDLLLRGSVLLNGPEYHVFIDGTKYTAMIEEKGQRKNSRGTLGDEKDRIIRSHMPSRIVMISVKLGDKITKGTRLLATEAMKMENVIKSPIDGVVKKVSCRVGQLVSSGQVLVELESLEEKS